MLLIKTTANSASWQFKYLFNGKRFVYSLGSLDKLDLPTARAKHKELWQQVKNGVNVAAEKQKIKNNKEIVEIHTISTLAKFYLKTCDKFKSEYSASVRNTISLITRFLIEPKLELFLRENINNSSDKKISISKFLNLPANDITEIEIKNFINNIKQPTPKARVAKILLAIYKKAILYKTDTKITNNPVEIIKSGEIKFEVKKRTRIVSDAELKELFKLLNNSKNQILATATKLLFMLGVRKNELLKSTWNEFDLENSVWNLPAERSKNGEAIKIPLSNQAITLLKTLQNNKKFVFNSFNKNKNAPISSAILNIYISNLIKKNSLIKENITPHDARRFVRTTLNKILDGDIVEKQFIAERCLNHSLQLQGVNTKILNVYLQDDFFKERKIALEKLAEYIEKITAEPAMQSK